MPNLPQDDVKVIGYRKAQITGNPTKINDYCRFWRYGV
jgi:hypothetical protein